MEHGSFELLVGVRARGRGSGSTRWQGAQRVVGKHGHLKKFSRVQSVLRRRVEFRETLKTRRRNSDREEEGDGWNSVRVRAQGEEDAQAHIQFREVVVLPAWQVLRPGDD